LDYFRFIREVPAEEGVNGRSYVKDILPFNMVNKVSGEYPFARYRILKHSNRQPYK